MRGPGAPEGLGRPSPIVSSGGAGASGCRALLATSHGHSGTCKPPAPPPRRHRDRRPRRWRVWPGRGPCGRWCWPGGSHPWRWPCWSREREALVKGVPTWGNVALARWAPTPSCTKASLSSPSFGQALRWREGAGADALCPSCSYPLGEVEGSDAQGPEAAEHGEDSKAQVVPGGQRHEVVFAFTVRRGHITLQNTSGFLRP